MENISKLKKNIIIYGNISNDISHIKIKSKEKIDKLNTTFPRSMPVYLSCGLKEIGIQGIDYRFHQILMNEFTNIIKENPVEDFSDNLPTQLWISCLINKLKSEFTIYVI